MEQRLESEGSITVEDHGGVLVGRMDGGPHGLLLPGILDDLDDLVSRSERDERIHAVVLTGVHPTRFLAHADIRWLQEGGAATPGVGARAAAVITAAASHAPRRVAQHTPLRDMVQLSRFHDVLLRMNTSGAVFVAALNGSALGGGCELALACDVRIMAAGDFLVGQPEVLLGFPPGGGGTQRLARLIGSHRALLLILDGIGLGPEQAFELGVVDAVVPAEELLLAALARAHHLGARDKIAVATSKRAVYQGASMALEQGLRWERVQFLQALSSPHAQAVMKTYQSHTAETGDLPLYQEEVYAAALRTGSLPESTRAADYATPMRLHGDRIDALPAAGAPAEDRI